MRIDRLTQDPILWLGAGLAGLIATLHHLWAWFLNGGDYTVFSVGPTVSDAVFDQTFQYAAAVRGFSRGGRFFVEDLWENAGVLNAYPALPSLVLGTLERFVGGLDLPWALVQALSAAAVWALVYCMARARTSSVWLAACVAWTVVILPFGPRNLLFLSHWTLLKPLDITRVASPALSFPLLLAALLCFARALATGKCSWVMGSALGMGALFHAYYCYWIAAYAVVAQIVLGAAFFLRGEYRAQILKRAFGIATIALGIGLPYLIVVKLGASGAEHQLNRVSHLGREISWPGVGLFGLGFFLFCRQLRLLPQGQAISSRSWETLLIIALMASTGVGFNFQLLSGREAQHVGHFMNKVFQPAFCLLAGLGICALSGARVRLWVSALSLVLSLGLVGLSTYRQLNVAQRTRQEHRASDPKVALLEWVREKLPPTAVLGTTDRELIALIPGLSGNFSFVPMGLRSVASDNEILLRYLLMSKLEGRTQAETLARLQEVPTHWERLWPSAAFVLFGRPHVGAVVRDLADRYWEELDIARSLLSRRIDYMVTETAFLPLAWFESAERIHAQGHWALIKLGPLRGTGGLARKISSESQRQE